MVIKTILKKKKCERAKWMSEEVLTNSRENKRSERQKRKGKIYPSECRVPKNSKERFHAKMGTITDRNSMDLTEAEDIKKRWQE